MAMMKCKECGKEHSTDAKACPNCGKRRTSSLTKIFAWFFAVVGVMTIWGMIQGQKAGFLLLLPILTSAARRTFSRQMLAVHELLERRGLRITL